jgi:phosphoglucosamine mutase
MAKYFGTDGIRGEPWQFPLSKDFIKKIGYSSAIIIGKNRKNLPIYLGRDTRASGIKIKEYLSAGFSSAGFKVIDLGIVSTPLVSFMAKSNKSAFGVMISASHNPPKFNGIKFFDHKGLKIDTEAENKIEKMLDLDFEMPRPSIFFRKKYDATKEYCDFILSTFPDREAFKNLKVVLDCSNGGAHKIAPFIFRKLGIDIKVIGNKPNGKNINIGCGALNTESMRKSVLKNKAYCGISLDGDADRCILSDEKGNIFDGDDIIALLSMYFKNNKKLKKSATVLTVMSNYGLFKYLKSRNIKARQVSVGDRNVTEAMNSYGIIIGGETSGHIILGEFLPTGDGVLSSLWSIYASIKLNKKFSEIKNMWIRYPQKVHSIKVQNKIPLDSIDGFNKHIKSIENKINGRILVRYSGTEPLLRILAEGENHEEIDNAVEDIVSYYKQKIRRGYAD